MGEQKTRSTHGSLGPGKETSQKNENIPNLHILETFDSNINYST